MGNELFKEVTQSTGLPEDLVSKELAQILSTQGVAKDEVTMEDLRKVMADYLREVILEAKEKFEDGVWIEETVSPEDLGKEPSEPL